MVPFDTVVDSIRYDREEARVRGDIKNRFPLVKVQAGDLTGDYGRGVERSGPGSLTVPAMRRAC